MQISISDRLFSKLPRYFGSLESALRELVHNAIRATASGGDVHISTSEDDDGNVDVTCVDTGVGIKDVGAMLSIAESGWDEEIERAEDPAGLGVFGVMAYCGGVTISSTFGSLEIDSARFFGDPAYRAGLLSNITTYDDEDTRVSMHRVKADAKTVENTLVAVCRYYNRVIYLDGRPVSSSAHSAVASVDGLHQTLTVPFNGADVQVLYSDARQNGYTPVYDIIWRGHRMKTPELREQHGSIGISSFPHFVVLVPDSAVGVVTPKLPDRTTVCETDGLHALTVEILKALYDKMREIAIARLQTFYENLCQSLDATYSDDDHPRMPKPPPGLNYTEYEALKREHCPVVTVYLPEFASDRNGEYKPHKRLLPAKVGPIKAINTEFVYLIDGTGKWAAVQCRSDETALLTEEGGLKSASGEAFYLNPSGGTVEVVEHALLIMVNELPEGRRLEHTYHATHIVGLYALPLTEERDTDWAIQELIEGKKALLDCVELEPETALAFWEGEYSDSFESSASFVGDRDVCFSNYTREFQDICSSDSAYRARLDGGDDPGRDGFATEVERAICAFWAPFTGQVNTGEIRQFVGSMVGIGYHLYRDARIVLEERDGKDTLSLTLPGGQEKIYVDQ